MAEYFWRYVERTSFDKNLKNRIEISVVIPTYNAASRLNVCLDSLWKQTFPFFEIICVDDGSTDDTIEILKSWQEKDQRITVLQQQHQGAGVARNRGLNEAKGKYVYFLDADDYLSLDALEGMHRKAEENSIDILFFDAYQFNIFDKEKILIVTKEEYIPDKKVFSGIDVRERIFEISYGYVWTKLYRRDFLIEQKLAFQEIVLAEALSFVYLSMMLAKRICYWKERPIHYYMDNPLGQSMNSNKNPLSVCKAWLDLKRQMENRKIYDLFERGYINKAAEHCMARFDVLSGIDSAQELFDYLKNTFFNKIEIDRKPDEFFYHDFVLKKRDIIMSSDFTKFIYEEYLTKRKNLRSIQINYGEISFSYLPRGSRIVLYGAGKRGKSFREKIINECICDIVLWVDKKSKNIEGEVCNPHTILSLDNKYDYVLIAVKEKRLADEIKNELINIGIQEKVILWHP